MTMQNTHETLAHVLYCHITFIRLAFYLTVYVFRFCFRMLAVILVLAFVLLFWFGSVVAYEYYWI